MPKDILIVDDAASIRQALSFVLSNNGFNVTEAADGDEALEKCGAKRFDLIISDVNMPNTDGLTFAERLKNNKDYIINADTPLIMLTTESSEEMRTEGRAAGVIGWMVKPFPPEKLLESINRVLGNKE
ncbi:MAG TPA: response regulator [Spirochaetota bacterium]|jgi:two-component system chemotaxis response regulator CheY|nr:response regulator [Spirochaetota bacterium]HOH36635.1 response regulator [Spirochaetota bacterium]HPW52477.1 response regulator [Spirochaetota bacterium]HPY02297.1 response regulator [Spirochaetota bacterium]